MKKDFINSYDQKSWEFAVKFHQFLTDALAKSTEYTPDSLKNRWMGELTKLEHKYPQLKNNFT